MVSEHDHLLGHHGRVARRVAGRQRRHRLLAVQPAAVGGGRTRRRNRHRGGRGRARPGEVRIALLSLLAQQPMHGYPLMRRSPHSRQEPA